MRARWWAAVPVVALVAGGGVYLDRHFAADPYGVPVRSQSARMSFFVHGTDLRPTASPEVVRSAADSAYATYVASGRAEPGADYQYWALYAAKPSADELANLAALSADVEVRYGDTLTPDQQSALGDRVLGRLSGRLSVLAGETSFNDGYDAVVVTYRPPNRANDAELSDAEHAALAEVAAAEPDHRLSFPVEFVRDPALTETGVSQ